MASRVDELVFGAARMFEMSAARILTQHWAWSLRIRMPPFAQTPIPAGIRVEPLI
jgi:hypothetical protein